jgi:hypothetical protein
VNGCNPSTWEAEDFKFEVGLGHTVRPCVRKKKKLIILTPIIRANYNSKYKFHLFLKVEGTLFIYLFGGSGV